MKIDGVPEGYELVRIGKPARGEMKLYYDGTIKESSGAEFDENYPILRKIEKPKQYRPFANAEEFKPHRDRWCKMGTCASRVDAYTDSAVYFGNTSFSNYTCFIWGEAFKHITFDDGTHFGVEVGE